MTDERIATCACGALRAHCRGAPVRVSVCHCLDCQKRTGSAFGAQARFAEDDVRLVGERTSWTRTSDEGNEITFEHCPRCGSTVRYRLAALPGFVAIPLGAFADPTMPAPTVSIYEARAHSWVHLEGVEHLD